MFMLLPALYQVFHCSLLNLLSIFSHISGGCIHVYANVFLICILRRVDSLEKTLMLGGIGDREAWRAAIHGVAKSQTRMSD